MRTLIAIAALVALALVTMGCSTDHETDAAPTSPDDVLEITVVEEDGTSRAATVACCPEGQITGGGYLTDLTAQSSAYITASANAVVAGWLLGNDDLGRPAECQQARGDLTRPYLRVEGRLRSEDVDVVVVRDSACGRRLWELTGPLREPRQDPIATPRD